MGKQIYNPLLREGFQKINKSSWKPNSIPLGALLTSGSSFFINGGAGIYLNMADGADDAFFFNDSLSKDGNVYDGSDIALKIHCRLDGNGGLGDTIGLILDSAIVQNGVNSLTTVTNHPQVDYDVSSELQDIEFDIVLSTISGIAGGETVMITVTRNATGASSDAYVGDFEITSLEWVKL